MMVDVAVPLAWNNEPVLSAAGSGCASTASPSTNGATVPADGDVVQSASYVATGNNNYDPAVCGSLVVCTDTRNGNPDIFGRDFTGCQEFPVATTPAVEAYPDCDGSRVVYMSAAPIADTYMFDRTTGATTVVSAQPWNEWQPAISGDRVVWQAWPALRASTSSASTSAPALRSR
jgi:hypothetical protein